MWCADYYSDYPDNDEKNPTGPLSGDMRVLRGGSWYYNNEGSFRCAYRDRDSPARRDLDGGFRLVYPG